MKATPPRARGTFPPLLLAAAAVLLTCAGCGGGGDLAPPVPVDSAELGQVPGGVIRPFAEPDAAAGTAPTGCSVVLYGDSIMAGQNPAGTLAETPAKTIKRLRPRYDVQARAVSGQSATQAAIRFANDPRPARVVVLEHGINDILLGRSPVSALSSMGQIAKAEGHAVIYTGLSRQARVDATLWQQYADGIADLAKSLAVGYADWSAVTGNTVDGTHPDQAMSIALAEKVVAALDAAAPECAR